MNKVNDQLYATITILLIFESAQHVSDNLLPIFRSVRLWLQQYGVLSNVVVGWRSGVSWCRLCVRCEGCCSNNIPHIEHIIYASAPRTSSSLQHWTIHHIAVNHSLTLRKMGKRLPEICWADSKINKIVIVTSSWSFILFTYISTAVVRIKNATITDVNVSPSISILVLITIVMVHLLASGILKRTQHLHVTCAEYR